MPFNCYKVEVNNASHDETCLKDIYLAIVENLYWIEYKDDTNRVFLYKRGGALEAKDPLEKGFEVATQMVNKFGHGSNLTINPLTKTIDPLLLQSNTLEEIEFSAKDAKLKAAISELFEELEWEEL